MASSYSPSTQVAMEYILSRLQRLEARLDALDLRWNTAHAPPRPDPDPPYGMPTTWRLSTWEPSGITTSPSTSVTATTQSSGLYQPTLAPFDLVRPPIGFRQPSHSPWPSLTDPHAPWESPWPRIAPEHCSNRSAWDYSRPCDADPPPSLTDSISCPLAEEAADSKVLGAAENQNPNIVNATSGGGSGGGDANNAVQSYAIVTNDDEREKTLEFTNELMACGSKAAKEGDYSEATDCYNRDLEIKVDKFDELALECASAYYKY